MNIIDAHSDVLFKLEKNSNFSFFDTDLLDVNLMKLKKAKIKLQALAIFVDPYLDSDKQYEVALKQIEIFKTKVLCFKQIVHIKDFKKVNDLKEDEIGVFLTLEGLDLIGNNIKRLEYLLDEGVLSVGLTWNTVNLVCDGVMEKRGAGLTEFGFKVINLLNERNILIDTAHISKKGFMDVIKSGNKVWNSHCCITECYNHKRNLNYDEVKAIVQKNGVIHLTFVPQFVKDTNVVLIDDLVVHFKKMQEWGFTNHLGFGSDFDGIKTKIVNLEDASCYQNLISKLEMVFTKKEIERIAYNNFIEFATKK